MVESKKNKKDIKNKELPKVEQISIEDISDSTIRYGDYVTLRGVENNTKLWDTTWLLLGGKEGTSIKPRTMKDKSNRNSDKVVYFYDMKQNLFLAHAPTKPSRFKNTKITGEVLKSCFDPDRYPPKYNKDCIDIAYTIDIPNNSKTIKDDSVVFLFALQPVNKYLKPTNMLDTPKDSYGVVDKSGRFAGASNTCTKDNLGNSLCNDAAFIIQKLKVTELCDSDQMDAKYKNKCIYPSVCEKPEYLVTSECLAWGQQAKNKPEYDQYMLEYCSKDGAGYKTPICGCYDGSFDKESIKLWETVKKDNPSIDIRTLTPYCYASCSAVDNVWMPSTFEKNCPVDICTNIANLSGVSNSNIQNIKQSCEKSNPSKEKTTNLGSQKKPKPKKREPFIGGINKTDYSFIYLLLVLIFIFIIYNK